VRIEKVGNCSHSCEFVGSKWFSGRSIYNSLVSARPTKLLFLEMCQPVSWWLMMCKSFYPFLLAEHAAVTRFEFLFSRTIAKHSKGISRCPVMKVSKVAFSAVTLYFPSVYKVNSFSYLQSFVLFNLKKLKQFNCYTNATKW